MSASNKMMLQSFEWHSEKAHYSRLARILPTLSRLGVTSIWLPPGCKAMNPNGAGYDVYDLWDLGEFDQKGARRTHWGSRDELDELRQKSKELEVDLIWDAVLSHKAGADSTEEVWAVEVDRGDRRLEIASPKQIEAWLRFDFPGRQHAGMPYSQMRWHSAHFNGTDWDHRERGKAVFKLIDPDTRSKSQSAYSRPSAARVLSAQRLRSLLRRRSSNITRSPVNSSQQPHRRPGKGWADDVDYENGNADYLMFSNVSWTHPEVRSDVINWGKWMVEDISIDGFRIDAARHISYSYMREWITAVAHSRHAKTGKELFVLGEVWHGEVARILRWLDAVQQPPGHAQVLAFDAPLLYNFSHLSEAITESKKPGDVPRLPAIGVLDLRTLFRGTLIASRPHQAVTMVTNHDTQPGREFTTPMDRKLKPLFYAFILLRREGLPCVFWGDLFGTHGPLSEPPVGHSQSSKEGENNQRNILAELMMCRKLFAHGLQRDYWDSPSCIGWTRTGDEMRPGCAVVVSIGNIAQAIQKGARAQSNYKKMFLGKPGDVFYDILGHIAEDVRIDEKGIGSFPLRGPGVSVFVGKDAPGVEDFPVLLDFGLLYSSTLSSRISA